MTKRVTLAGCLRKDEVRWISVGKFTGGHGTKDALIRLTAEWAYGYGRKTVRILHTQPINLRYRSDVDVVVEPRYLQKKAHRLGGSVTASGRQGDTIVCFGICIKLCMN